MPGLVEFDLTENAHQIEVLLFTKLAMNQLGKDKKKRGVCVCSQCHGILIVTLIPYDYVLLR